MVSRVLITGAVCALAAAASCYHPDLVDCVDTCSSSNLCPDGLTCKAGFCRSSGATGTCAGGQQPDAASSVCPNAPGNQGVCTMPMPMQPNLPECFAVCAGSAVTGSQALGFHFMTWYAADMTSATGVTDGKAQIAGRGPLWIGLHAPHGMGTTRGSWSWESGVPATYTDGWAPGQPVDTSVGSADNCAALTGSGWISEPCANTHLLMVSTPAEPKM